MTLETADLLAIAGIVLGSMLTVVGGALAWLRADIAKLDDRQRATDAKVDSLTQTLLATALARNPLVPPPDPPTPPSASESEPLEAARRNRV